MATYVNDLRLKEIATGDESGTWGTSTNTNLELIAEAFSFGTEAITTNADTHTTTIADGSTDPGRSMYLKYTGTLDSACTITIGPNTVSKMWFIENGTSGSQNIIISQGSGANITIPPGDVKVVYSDGAGSGAAVVDAFASLNVGALTATSLDISGDIDVDGTTNLDVVDIDGAVDFASTTAHAGNATFADNAKAIFGAGSDLQIYHDGSNSYIDDVTGSGTGDLFIKGSDAVRILTPSLVVNNAANNENMITAAQDGAATLYHNGSPKIATTATGIDVTGTAVTDGLTVAGNLSVDGGTIKLDGNYPTGTNNVALGDIALADGSLSGGNNTAIGRSSLYSNTSGANNTGIGSGALENNTTASNNTAVGYHSLLANTTGANNVAVGALSLDANTTGSRNTAVGYNTLSAYTQTGEGNSTAVGYIAGASLTTGQQNTAIGSRALTTTTTAASNVAVGYAALESNTTGASNTAVGDTALDANTTASYNTAVGQAALSTNTTGDQNTAVGRAALNGNTTGSNNVAVGVSALIDNSTGHSNVAVGHTSLFVNTTGISNTAVGASALDANTTASNNTAVGTSALGANTTGGDNTAMGRNALDANTTGVNNVAIGESALSTATTASGNTAIGKDALAIATGGSNTVVGKKAGDAIQAHTRNTIMGDSAGGAVNSSDNTFIGQNSGSSITSGDANTILGRYSGNEGGLDIRTSSNNIVLSDGDGNARLRIDSAGRVGVGDQGMSPNGILEVNDDSSDPIFVVHKNSTGVSDAVVIRHGRGLSGFSGTGIDFQRNDGTTVGTVVIGFTSTAYNTSSDYRLKENVNYTWDATTKLKQLKPARFNFIEETDVTVDGFLAHEVQDIVPQAVTGEKDAVDGDGNPEHQSIDHSKLVPLLVKTIQELEARITALES